MAECLSVDPHELAARGDELRSIRASLMPSERTLGDLVASLAAVGDQGWSFLGATFCERWSLTLAQIGGVLDDSAARLDAAAATYQAYEELLAEALGE